MEKAIEDASPDITKVDEYEFLRVGRKQKRDAVDKAFARVQSMVRHPEAREQYMRLVSNFEKLEVIFIHVLVNKCRYQLSQTPKSFQGSCCQHTSHKMVFLFF